MEIDLVTPIFISSTVYGLEDLRAALAEHLRILGCRPYLSSEKGFPDTHGLPPYASCLPVLESCSAVVAVIDQRYGTPFQDWGEVYAKFNGLSPTHAEIRDTIVKGIPLWVFARKQVFSDYQYWKDNKKLYPRLDHPRKTEVKNLELLSEIKNHHPAPWTVDFENVTDITKALSKKFSEYLQRYLCGQLPSPQNDPSPIESVNPASQFSALIIDGLGKNGIILRSSTDMNDRTAQHLTFTSGCVVDIYHNGTVVIQKVGDYEDVKKALEDLGIDSKVKIRTAGGSKKKIPSNE